MVRLCFTSLYRSACSSSCSPLEERWNGHVLLAEHEVLTPAQAHKVLCCIVSTPRSDRLLPLTKLQGAQPFSVGDFFVVRCPGTTRSARSVPRLPRGSPPDVGARRHRPRWRRAGAQSLANVLGWTTSSDSASGSVVLPARGSGEIGRRACEGARRAVVGRAALCRAVRRDRSS